LKIIATDKRAEKYVINGTSDSYVVYTHCAKR